MTQCTFIALVQQFSRNEVWEQHFACLDSYFNILTEIVTMHSDYTLLPGLQELCPLIVTFFSTIFHKAEPVRTKADTLIASLQKQHFERMAFCFERRFAIGSEAERAELCAFSLKIQKKIPQWQVLSFAALLSSGLQDQNEPSQEFSLPFLTLAGNYVASGHSLSYDELLRLKLGFARALGFGNAQLSHLTHSEAKNHVRPACHFVGGGGYSHSSIAQADP